jgi:hypothetical protein
MWIKQTCVLVTLCIAVGCEPASQTTLTSSSTPPPSFEYLQTGGCGRFTVYATNQGPTEVFVASGDLDSLGIPEEGRVLEFDLANAPLILGQKSISITVEMYPRPQKHLHHCQDFTDPESDKPTIWTGISGRLQIQRFAPDKKEEGRLSTFRLKVTVTEVEFQDPSGRKVKCSHPVVLDTTVGWFAG